VLRFFLCLSMLSTLACAARADQLGTAASIWPESMPGLELVGGSTEAAPVLDLSFDPPSQVAHGAGPVVTPASPPPAERHTDAPFSVGLKIKTGREVAGPPRRVASDPEDPVTLTDKVEGIVERSSFGLTGTYRF
jgi:hypothetical protein